MAASPEWGTTVPREVTTQGPQQKALREAGSRHVRSLKGAAGTRGRDGLQGRCLAKRGHSARSRPSFARSIIKIIQKNIDKKAKFSPNLSVITLLFHC